MKRVTRMRYESSKEDSGKVTGRKLMSAHTFFVKLVPIVPPSGKCCTRLPGVFVITCRDVQILAGEDLDHRRV
jgi:hypothetical protein